jgi:putative heme-binding domain-containing protein
MFVRRSLFASLIVKSFVVASAFVASSSTDRTFAADAPAKRPAWTTSKIIGTPEKPEPYRVVDAFSKLAFVKPTSIEELPDSKRILITEMSGKIYTFPKQADVAQADLLLDLVAALPKNLEKPSVSLFDAEPHPKFADNGYLYVSYVCPDGGNHTRLSRFTVDRTTPKSEAPKLVPQSELVLLRWPSGGHNGGCIEFGTDGYLYLSTGDGSGPNPPDGLTTGQTVDDLLGAVLRIDVDNSSASQAYAIPKDNPFVATSGAKPEIYSYGMRNPWKFGIDTKTGEAYVADNGWETWEVIHKLAPGSNCGWPVMEGRASLRSEVKTGPTPITPPIKDHSHTEANSVIGGPVYRGQKLSGLVGSFVYGDYITGTIWSVQPDEDKSYSCTTLCDTDLRIVAFTELSSGELYVLDYDATGKIYELLPQNKPDLSATFPRKLSETGLFVRDAKGQISTSSPAAGVFPYAVVAPRWMDGAIGSRVIALPGTERVKLSTNPSEASVYPEGTVFAKTVVLPHSIGSGATTLETQILHYEDGTWRPYSYLWNEAGTDADLVSSVGTSRTLKLPSLKPGAKEGDGSTDRTWHVNAVNECKLCHNVGPKFVLGFVPQQLDHIFGGHATITPVLLGLQGAGVVAAPAPSGATWTLVDPHDKSQQLDDRARSYLHANCAACHHPGGNAIVSFFLRRDLPFDKLNTNKGTGIGTFGMNDAKLIVPGDPTRSVLFYRMSKLGYARMPYIGSKVVDSRGVALIDEWIRSLGPKPTAPPTGVALAEAIKSTGTALELTAQMHGGKLREYAFLGAVAMGSKSPDSNIRGLFETFIPESQRKATLGAKFDPKLVLDKTGDHDRGKLIFFSDGARCRNCHELDDKQKSIGPTLADIVKKYPKRDEMLQHVQQPSLKIEEVFAAYSATMDDGRTISGLIVEQNDAEVVLKTAERQLVRLARKNIEELVKSPKSLMPDGILSDLTAQEAADLFEYIRKQKKPE